MDKLVKIELFKIFRHKSIYIIFFIIFSFCLLNNILYKNNYDENGFYKYDDVENLNKFIRKLSKKNEGYDVTNDNDKLIYVTNKTKIDIAKIKKGYKSSDWRYIKVKDYLYEDIYNYNYHNYVTKDNNKMIFYKKNFKYKLGMFNDNNYLYFLRKEKNELEKEDEIVNSQLKNIGDLKIKEDLNEEKKNINIDLAIINCRLKNKISYSDTYVNRALLQYRQGIIMKDNYKKSDKFNYQKSLSNYYISKYIVDNKINVNKMNTLNYQLQNIVDDYELFIVLVILITVSIIIGEEFNKGTIKLLLIKPFDRNKILLSKFLACFMMIIITIMFIFSMNFLLGSLLLGVDSLKNGVVIYSFNLHKVLKINIFVCVLMRVVVKLPMFIVIEVISMLLCIVLTSTICSFSITMLLYTFSEVINKLAINYKLKFMKYFLTLNWNFKDYLFGGVSEYPYIDFKKSILILVIYVIIFLGVMFKTFENKDIKNV